jgi:hypothetical protein
MTKNSIRTTHDFNDGRGHVPAHRHQNPDGSVGGWVSDDSDVSSGSTVGDGSTVSGSTVGDGSTVSGSTVSDGSTVSGSTVSDGSTVIGSTVIGSTVRGSTVIGSTVIGSTVRGSTVRGSTVIGSTVRGSTVIDGKILVADVLVDPTTLPAVADLDRKIAEAVAIPGALDMSGWHCGSSHCRAGWAIHLAGAAGYALEKQYGSEVAGILIYLASTGRTRGPDFFASHDEALADIRRCAAEAEVSS